MLKNTNAQLNEETQRRVNSRKTKKTQKREEIASAIEGAKTGPDLAEDDSGNQGAV